MIVISERATDRVSHHLRALRSSGLVRSRREGKLVIYALTDDGGDLVRAVLGVGSTSSQPDEAAEATR